MTTMEHFGMIVNSFTDEDDLMNFAVNWGIQETPEVRFRLFQLRNGEYGNEFVNEELDGILGQFDGLNNQNEDFEIALDYIRTQHEVEECIKALLFDEEMQNITDMCINDGEWNPPSPTVITGGGDESGPSQLDSQLQYTLRKKSERTYAKTSAVERTYQIKINEQYQGQRLEDVREGLHRMFDDVLDQARGDLAGNDLGRVVIQHNGLADPIVVPLQPWDQLNADKVMSSIENVLNSDKELAIDESLDISVGSIDLPKGSAYRRITNIKGKNNCLRHKHSIVTIENTDQMCMARAIGVSWAKLKRCSKEEWYTITKNHRQNKSNLQLVIEHRMVPESYYKNLIRKQLKEQEKLAFTLSRMAGVPTDRPASLSDLQAFEDILGVRVMVVSARLGNKFITSPSSDERPCIYIYLADEDHFHAITSITGFFSAEYFCHKCLVHYKTKHCHQCDITCFVCKMNQCLKTKKPVKCQDCNMECRSTVCYEKHKQVPLHKKGKFKGTPRGPSQCEKWWKCPKCYKVLRVDKRNTNEHECGEYLCNSCKKYVLEGHLCYLRATQAKEHHSTKFVFFDFECSQDETLECTKGYKPLINNNCNKCQLEKLCTSCSKCNNCNSSWCGKTTHRPNFVVAHTVCSKCIDQPLTSVSVCEECGSRCKECYTVNSQNNTESSEPCPGKCGFREVTFKGNDTSKKFGEWLFSNQHKHFKAVAHHLQGYDGYFLLEYLIDQSIRPDKIIYNGSKIMYMDIGRGLHIKIIDSLNFLPMKLSALPEAFCLNELKKGWFPHYFNTKENQNYIGPYPDAQYYGHNFMSEKERTELLAWLKEKENEVFDFRKEILEYCRSDVDILRQACLTFREILMNVTGERKTVLNERGEEIEKLVGAVDPFNSITIASVCMDIFKTKFLEEEWKVKLSECDDWVRAKVVDGKTYVLQGIQWVLESNLKNEKVTQREFVSSPIAQVPPNGYTDQHSKISIEWLEWTAHRQNIKIQHALKGSEKRVIGSRYKLDGFCPETNTAYDFHGCFIHACLVCFPDNRNQTLHPLTKQSLNEQYVLTLKKKDYIEKLGFRYIYIWEHEFTEEKERNPELRKFVETLDLTDRLNPRESFFGGRTNASQLYYRVSGNEKIKYVDFTSLYPWVNKYAKYPVGHPTLITTGFKAITEYFGIVKIKILPPRGLYHPVLPYRSNDKLKFPLCRSCADTENQNPCTCSDEERELTGTWCTPEVQTAVRVGYKIQKVYEIYHWEKTAQYDTTIGKGGLFAEYINTFLKFKQEASGLPDWIQNEEDEKSYISQYFKKERVMLTNIHENPGLRALAKLCLNSFWGKFGQRLNMRQTELFHETEADKFFQLLTDKTKQPLNFHILSNDMLQMEWNYKSHSQPCDNKTNIYLATFTTCWARLKLYSVLEVLDRRVLYYDTDSVIYVSREGHYDPPLGDYLGEFTNELKTEGEHIVEFVSGGPKNYAYKTNKHKEVCKVRGFTLNYTNSKLINFESVKQIVTENCLNDKVSNPCNICRGNEKRKSVHKNKSEKRNEIESSSTIVVTNPSKICRVKSKRKLVNREEKKCYRMVYTKRRRLSDYDTVPYGY